MLEIILKPKEEKNFNRGIHVDIVLEHGQVIIQLKEET